MEKSADAFRTISEVAEDLVLPQHVLRFWESRFPQIRPLKRAGGRRYYRPADVILLRTIRQLLYDEGYTIKGVQRLLKERGTKAVRAGTVPNPVDLAPIEDGLARNDVGLAVQTAVEFETAGQILPDSIRATLEALAPPETMARQRPSDVEAWRETLSIIEECERILKGLRN